MARTLLSLLLWCFVSLHTALPTVAAADEPVSTVSLLAGEVTDSDDDRDARGSSDTATACHDGCSWLAGWHSPVLHEARRSPQNGRTLTIPAGLISLIARPPR